jgi:mono/diheme cytochrome c family protein
MKQAGRTAASTGQFGLPTGEEENMKSRYPAVLGLAASTLLVSPFVLGQTRPDVDFGKSEYMSNCAVCHGVTGKGDGFYEGLLRAKPTDLTTLAKANGGVFPTQRVYETIDGRRMVPAHGTRDMPIWGTDYYAKGAPFDSAGGYDPEAYVRVRVMALVDYVARMQAK